MAGFALCILAISVFLSLFAENSWVTDLFTHFQFQYVAGGIILGIWFGALKKWPPMFLALFLCLFSSYKIYASFEFVSQNSATNAAFKIMHYNRKYEITDHKNLVRFLSEEKPDVVVLQEATKSHSDAAKILIKTYPYQIHEPRVNAFGMVVLSKYPFKEYRVKNFERIALDNIQMRFVFEPQEGHEVVVYALHPPPPTSAALRNQRNMELDLTTKDIKRDTEENIIMLGDWNITPFSPVFKSVLDAAELKQQHTEFPAFPTWPSPFSIPFLQIPIDHILHKGRLQLLEKKRGPAMGSDHYPVIATFAISAHD
ncbi:MAG: endonuclease/exonuclease/phosphatase family protein [Alphaproteobacteria bacterium]